MALLLMKLLTMKHILYCLGLLALTLPASASLWVPDTANYQGDFSSNGSAIANADIGSNSQDRNPSFQELQTSAGAGGWASFVGPAWGVSSGEAVRTGGDGSRANGLAMVFSDPGFTGQATLSFNYQLGNETPNDNDDQGFVLVGISDITTAGFTGNGFRSINSPPASNLTGGYTLLASDLATEADNTQGTIDGDASGLYTTTVNLDSASYTHYGFAFFGSPNGTAVSLDNVSLAPIPEPSTALALFGLLGLAGMIRRRRALPADES